MTVHTSKIMIINYINFRPIKAFLNISILQYYWLIKFAIIFEYKGQQIYLNVLIDLYHYSRYLYISFGQNITFLKAALYEPSEIIFI